MPDAQSTLITGIGELVSNDGEAGAFAAMIDAALVIAAGKVAWTGPAARAPAADTVVDAAGRAVLPGLADSHAHLVFAGERSAEFAARMAGRPYRAGGILGTVEATRAASDAVLRTNLRRLVIWLSGNSHVGWRYACKRRQLGQAMAYDHPKASHSVSDSECFHGRGSSSAVAA